MPKANDYTQTQLDPIETTLTKFGHDGVVMCDGGDRKSTLKRHTSFHMLNRPIKKLIDAEAIVRQTFNQKLYGLSIGTVIVLYRTLIMARIDRL